MSTTAPGLIRLTEELSDLDLGDARLNKRACKLIETLGQQPDRSVPAACGGWDEIKAAYRFFDSDKVTAQSLLVCEVFTPGGNWSSYPPHKHDRDAAPAETRLEETYYHRINPPQGFAFQRVYTDDRSLDETMAVEDRNVVMVPEGYHPVGAPHGYDLYYLNVMAGPERTWIFHNGKRR
jgi:5-deoxy-glucuronate isomerase